MRVFSLHFTSDSGMKRKDTPDWLWWLDLFEMIEGNSNSIVVRNKRWLDSSTWLQIEFSPVCASVCKCWGVEN